MTFKYAAWAAAFVVATFGGWMLFQPGGAAVTRDFEDLVQTFAALVAAASCAAAARRGVGMRRPAWTLIAGACLTWALSDLVRATSLVMRGAELPYPSTTDAGFFVAVPLEVAGVVLFLAATTRVTSLGRAIADGATVSFCVLFISWAFAYPSSKLSEGGALLSFAPPAGDITTGILLTMAVLRTPSSRRGPYLMLLAGFAALLLSDVAFGFLNVLGDYVVSLLNTGWVLGFLLIALAALMPTPAAQSADPEGAIPIWEMALTWSGLVGVMISGAAVSFLHLPGDPALGYIGAALGVSLIAGQAVWYFDSNGLLQQTRDAEKSLRARTNLLQQIFNHAPLAIVRANKDLVIIDANPAMQSLLRQPAAALIGTNTTAYLGAPAEAELREMLRPLFAGTTDTVDGESEVVRADGTRVWTQWRSTAVRGAGGDIEYFLAMLLDADARHEAEQAAMANLEGLERLNRLKSEFVSMVSHEMRTALTGIQGFSEVMQSQPVTADEVREIAGDINSDAARLNRMITEMLDLDRLESGRTKLHLAPVDVNDLIRQAVLRGSVLSAHHQFVSDLGRHLPPVMGDADRLLEVLMNLVSNAVKYSPGGQIVLSTCRTPGHVRVSVSDHGQGIAPEFADRLFSRYERYEGNARGVIGTGLGLAICRQVLELHRGRIWVDSVPGDGSTFHFEIPVAPFEDDEDLPPAS
ncbi:MAG TPA: HAMP domain-containing sensor histidine kinase [Candidatus Udaeobacter sp.]|nr:HAMP domain-containing sensor histidine kinase [Candidatus Udaeobacter sp.]